MIDLSRHPANLQPEPHLTRGGVTIRLPSGTPGISPAWTIGDFSVSFASIAAGQTLNLVDHDGTTCLKVITGEIDAPPYRPFPATEEVSSTVSHAAAVSAVQDSVLCFVTQSSSGRDKITDMAQLQTSGPLCELLQWQSFHEKFGAVTDVFAGLDAHMLPGFHLLDPAETEIAYVHFWTTGKGVDVTTHNHSHAPSELAPAFAETHLVLRNGTNEGAMYQCSEPGAKRKRTVVLETEEHGAFFRFDPTNGAPLLLENGAVDYPWHGWQGGQDQHPGQVYDLVTAFEINPSYARAC